MSVAIHRLYVRRCPRAEELRRDERDHDESPLPRIVGGPDYRTDAFHIHGPLRARLSSPCPLTTGDVSTHGPYEAFHLEGYAVAVGVETS